MGQPASLELAPRRWQRRALPVELCLPCTCHIPSCKRTVRLFRSHCRSGGSAFASVKKSGTPPGIRTRNFMFLRHARMPIPPAGQTKTRGPCGATRALEESRRDFAASRLLRSRWHARGHGRTRATARPARCLSALGLSLVAMSCKAFQSSSLLLVLR